MDSTYHIE